MTNRFKGKTISQKVKFMDDTIEISKLTVSQVMKIQEAASALGEGSTEADNTKVLFIVIQSGALELAELTEDEMGEFPMEELSRLSNEIMKYSGVGGAAKVSK
jgi:hypothetical protein